MKQINKITEQLSGIVEIYVIPSDNVRKIENKKLYCYLTDMVFAFQFSKETASNSINQQYVKAGQPITHKVQFYLPGQSDANEIIFRNLKKHKHIVVIRDTDGNYKIIGNLDHNLVFTFEYTNNADYNGSKGYTITLQGETLESIKPIQFPFEF